MESYFNDLAAAADRALAAGERHTLGFFAEETDFVRMCSRVRNDKIRPAECAAVDRPQHPRA